MNEFHGDTDIYGMHISHFLSADVMPIYAVTQFYLAMTGSYDTSGLCVESNKPFI